MSRPKCGIEFVIDCQFAEASREERLSCELCTTMGNCLCDSDEKTAPINYFTPSDKIAALLDALKRLTNEEYAPVTILDKYLEAGYYFIKDEFDKKWHLYQKNGEDGFVGDTIVDIIRELSGAKMED